MPQLHGRRRARVSSLSTFATSSPARASLALAWALAGSVAAVGCSSDPDMHSGGGSGGRAGTGGATGTGGSAAGSGGSAAGTGGAAAGSGGGVGAGSGGAGAGSGGAGAGTGGAGTGGGAAGTGGRAGTGGGAGGGAGGAPAGSGGAGGSSGAAPFFTEGFEGGMNGKQPAGWDNFISWVKNGTNPQGDTMAVVDSTRAHGGTSSVHFHGGTNPAMITRALPSGTNKLYVRVWVYMSRQLGMNPNPSANHETMIGIRKATGSANDEVRFGEIKGVIGTNEVPSDNIAPKMAEWGKGPVIAANKWACIEVAFIADQPQHTLTAWADGMMVHSITAPDQWQNGALPAAWMSGKFVEVIFGWHSFSSSNADIWMDNLALGTARIGCN